VGHVVDFQVNQFGWRKTLPIRQMSMSFPAPNIVRYDLELSLKIDTPFSGVDLARLRYPKAKVRGPGTGDIPDVPVGEGAETTTTGCVLIDHFDDDVGLLTLYTQRDTAEIHTVSLPDGIGVGDTVFLVVGTETVDFPPGDPTWVELIESGWTIEGDTDPYSNLTFLYREVDGSEGFSGTDDKVRVRLLTEAGGSPKASAISCVSGLTKSRFYFGSVYHAGPYAPAYIFAKQTYHTSRKIYLSAVRRGGHLGVVSGLVKTSQGHEYDNGWDTRYLQELREGEMAPFAFSSRSTDVDLFAQGGSYPVYFQSNEDGTYNTYGYVTTISALIEVDALEQAIETPGPEVTGAAWHGGNPWSIVPYNPSNKALDWGVRDSSLYVWGGTTTPGDYAPYLDASLFGSTVAISAYASQGQGTVVTPRIWGPWEGMSEGILDGVFDVLVRWRCDSLGGVDMWGYPLSTTDYQHLSLKWTAFRPIADGEGYESARAEATLHLQPGTSGPSTSIANDSLATSWEYSVYDDTVHQVSNDNAPGREALPLSNYVPGEWMLTRFRFDGNETWDKTPIYSAVRTASITKILSTKYGQRWGHVWSTGPVGSWTGYVENVSTYGANDLGSTAAIDETTWPYRAPESGCSGLESAVSGTVHSERWVKVRPTTDPLVNADFLRVKLNITPDTMGQGVTGPFPIDGWQGKSVGVRAALYPPSGFDHGVEVGRVTFTPDGATQTATCLIPIELTAMTQDLWIGICPIDRLELNQWACGIVDALGINGALGSYGYYVDDYTSWTYEWYNSSGTSIGDPPPHIGTVRVKTWRMEDEEPTTATVGNIASGYENYPQVAVSYPFTTDPGWDCEGPFIWIPIDDARYTPGWLPTEEHEMRLQVQPSVTAAYTVSGNMPSRWEVDKICLYGASTVLSEGSITPSDQPIYDGSTAGQTGQYVTKYPYQPGTLVVYVNGIRLRKDIDYVETDPQSGGFTLIGDGDYSAGVTTQYIRSGTIMTEEGTLLSTGGIVYRPAGQLQWGWGTRMDAYNSVMTCSAIALDRHSEGAYSCFTGTPRSNPPNHRNYSGNPYQVGDVSDAMTAWQVGWNEYLEIGDYTWDNFISRLNEKRGAILMGLNGLMAAEMRCSEAFSGRHALFVNERFANGNLLAYDPLHYYPRVYTEAQIQGFAMDYRVAGKVRAALTGVT
jgi:hypothetical protein